MMAGSVCCIRGITPMRCCYCKPVIKIVMNKRIKNYVKSFSSDFPASVVVFLVALPLCLGIALGSNAPLLSGIIGGIVGGIVVGALSGSQLSVSGPAAGLTAIVAAGIGKMPAYEAFTLSIVLAGIFQIIFGYIKAGIVGDYVPSAVIKGMLAAIGLILILKQLPHLVGYNADYEGDETFLQQDNKNTFSGILQAARYIIPLALVIGVVGIIVQVLWQKGAEKGGKLFKLMPAPLVVVALGILINELAKAFNPSWAIAGTHLVNIPAVESLDALGSFFTFPDFSFILHKQVWITAVTIAIVASLETLLNIGAADELDTYQRVTPPNRELKAQGVGNVVSGLLGGLPLTSVIVRTSVNINAGAKTKISAIIHGFLLLLFALFFPKLLNYIPLSALAAILIYTGYKLAKPALLISFYKKGWDQFMPFVITVAAILFTDLLVGILIGCFVGLFYTVRSNFRSAVFVVNDGSKYLFRLRKDVSFLNKPVIKCKLEQVPNDGYVLIDISRADFIDKDVLEVIEDYTKHAPLKNIKVEIKRSLYQEEKTSREIKVPTGVPVH
jgi:MFS superfamily sulfate permease-like transporter